MTSGWYPRSVRVRLTLWYATAVGAVLILYAGGVFIFLRRSLSPISITSCTRISKLLSRCWSGQLMVGSAGGPAIITKKRVLATTVGWRRGSPEGKLLYRRATGERRGREFLFPAAPSGQRGYQSIALPNDVHFRAMTGPYSVDGLPLVIRVARSEARLHRAE
jgi:hypothetical protein